MIIYKITNLINNKIYIGQDKNNNPKYMGSGNLIKKAMKKYGKQNFIKEVISECKTVEELNEKEKYYIDLYESRNQKIGYNISIGGESGMLGLKHTEETKEKMRLNNIGSNNPMYGKKLSIESIKMSIKTRNENGFTYNCNNNPNFKFEIKKEELSNLYLEKILPISNIAQFYGCSYHLILKKIKEFNLKRENTRKKYFFNINEINIWLKNGESQKNIAEKYGCSYKFLNKFINKNKNNE
jgi:group I intron endonuclease